MNSTNRGANRVVIFLVGLVLLAAGAAAAAAAAVPAWLSSWKYVASHVEKNAAGYLRTQERLTAPSASSWFAHGWVLIAVPLLCAILIALLLVFILRQGHGRTGTLLRATPGPEDAPSRGAIVIDAAVAEQAIQHALADHPGLVSSGVTTYAVHGTGALKITANLRRGVSPREIRSSIDEIVTAWDEVLGTQVPVVIQLNAGLLTRVAKPARLHSQQPERALT